MPSRGSALAVAVASTTFSPRRTTAAPWACLANFPVSNESCLPPARSTVTLLTSGFMFHPLEQLLAPSFWLGTFGSRRVERGARLCFPIGLRLVRRDALKRCTLQKVLNARPASRGRRRSQIPLREQFPELLADAELPNDDLVALGIVSLEVVQ